MATTPGGWPYVLPADHPLEYPALSQQLANKLEAEPKDVVGARRILTQSSVSIPNNVLTSITGGWVGGSGDSNGPLLTYSAGIVTLTSDAVLDLALFGLWSGANTGKRQIGIIAAGNTVAANATWSGGTATCPLSCGLPGGWYPAGTQFQVQAFQDSGGALNITNLRWHIRRAAKA